jgi:LPS sulfotransferase NodH
MFDKVNFKPLIILFSGSCGSSWLCDILHNQDGFAQPTFEPLTAINKQKLGIELVDEYLEVLLIEKDKPKLVELHRKLSHEQMVTDAVEKLNQASVVFFKARSYEFTRNSETLINSSQVPIIWLQRRNRIKHAISVIKRVRMKLGHFNYKEILPPIAISPDEIEQHIKFIEDFENEAHQFLQALTNSRIPVFYEDLLSDMDTELIKISDYLDMPIDSQHLISGYQKVTSDDLKYALSNYEEVHHYFINTAYAEHFES